MRFYRTLEGSGGAGHKAPVRAGAGASIEDTPQMASEAVAIGRPSEPESAARTISSADN